MGAVNKVSGNEITGNKILRKIYPKKKNQEKSPKSCENEVERSSLRHFQKKDFFTHLYFEYSYPYSVV